MSRYLPLIVPGALVLALSGCGGSARYVSDHPSGTGPFDSRGNYVEAWADDPSKWSGKSVPTPSDPPEVQLVSNDTPPPPPVTVTAPSVAPRPTPSLSTGTTTVTISNPKPKPKPVVKPKPKPKSTIHSVRKGDTLYGLAKRYGTTVGALQRANSIKGSTIRIGQKIKIPG